MTIRTRSDLVVMVIVEIVAAALALAAAPTWMRIIVGLPAVLVIPGYALTAVVFPSSRELNAIERLAYSIGLSIAIVSALALVLDRTPWGLQQGPVVLSLLIFVGISSVLATYLRRRLDVSERPTLVLKLDAGMWRDATIGQKAAQLILGATVVVAVWATVVAIRDRDNHPHTEFYVLGATGLAEKYPLVADAGSPASVTVGIRNSEEADVVYQVEVDIAGQKAGGTDPIALPSAGTWERPVSFVPPVPGQDQEVSIQLFRGQDRQPYRTLRLWLDVRGESQSP